MIENTVDSRLFRTVLGHFATGVAVVTAAGSGHGHEKVGLTITSFNSVSLDPPLVLFSLARRLHSLPALMDAKYFAINLLRQDQRHLSNQFATAGGDKWAGVATRPGVAGSPLIDPCLAYFECKAYERYDGGDHIIFLGNVINFWADETADPLLFFRGGYSSLYRSDAA